MRGIRAQGLIEYVLILSLIATVCVVALRTLGTRVNEEATEISELMPR